MRKTFVKNGTHNSKSLCVEEVHFLVQSAYVHECMQTKLAAAEIYNIQFWDKNTAIIIQKPNPIPNRLIASRKKKSQLVVLYHQYAKFH